MVAWPQPTHSVRTLASTGFDYWESAQDFLRGAELYDNFVGYQALLLDEFHRLTDRYGSSVVDARGANEDVFSALCAQMRDILDGMADEVAAPVAGTPKGLRAPTYGAPSPSMGFAH